MTTRRFGVMAPLTPEPIATGTRYPFGGLPLHVTTLGNFRTEQTPDEIIALVRDVASRYDPVTVWALGEAWFGPNRDVAVVTLTASAALRALHEELYDFIARGGGTPDEPHYVGDGFRPHCTVTEYARLAIGDTVVLDQLAIVDVSAPDVRLIVAVLPLGTTA